MKIEEMFLERRFKDIVNLKDDIINNDSNDKNLYYLVYSMFLEKQYDEVISLTLELKNKGKERLDCLFFFFLVLIYQNDIYMAKSYIQKSPLLNSNEIINIISGEVSAYTNIKNHHNIDEIPGLLLLNYMCELNANNEESLMYKYYEMVDMIYELRYDLEIIDYMNNIGNIIFK